jgi:hypothetical protein
MASVPARFAAESSYAAGGVRRRVPGQSRQISDTERLRSGRSSPFTHFKGGFFHDGRFPTLNAVVDHYNTCFNFNLAPNEKVDLIQYLLSLTF